MMMMRFVLLLVLLFPGLALSADGVLEINQACAAGPGCFTGDGAGFPVTIAESNSYRLTSDLVPPADVSAIVSGAGTSHVTLNLAGFALRGSGTTGRGIELDGVKNWEIRDGSVLGFAQGGIFDASANARLNRFIRLRLLDNGGPGLSVRGRGHRIDGCLAANNAGPGLAAGTFLTVESASLITASTPHSR